MKKYNFLAIIICAIISIGITTSCGTCKTKKETFALTQNTPFTVNKAYCQKWVAGVKGGGAGLNLYASINNISEGVIMKEFYFRDQITDVKSSKDNLFIGYYKSDANRDVIMDSNSIKEAANTPPENFPFKLENNEAVLSYEYNNKMHYYKIANIEEKEMIAYPSSNPNNKL